MDEAAKIAAMVQCNLLAVRFWSYTDDKNFAALADLFVPAGIWVRPEGLALSAPDGMLAYLAKRSATIATCHVVTNVDVRVTSGSEAQSTSYITAYKHDDGKAVRVPAPLHGTHRILKAHDQYVLTASGWRIARKEVNHVFDAGLNHA